jgi:hypothetical protein
VDEVNLEPVDLGRELRERVEPHGEPPEVILGRPVTREFLNHREPHALRLIPDGLLLGPARRRNAPTEVVQRLLGNVDLEPADLGANRANMDACHHQPPFVLGACSSTQAGPVNATPVTKW